MGAIYTLADHLIGHTHLLSKGKAGPHEIQGIGANIAPEALDRSAYDDITVAKSESAFETAKKL